MNVLSALIQVESFYPATHEIELEDLLKKKGEIDRRRINSLINHIIPIVENIHLANQVEVVFGLASALSREDAFVEVINYITKDSF
ncbi:MAG: hypothetical protein RMJ97_03330 [Raineya sp.]|nr:hypothetical protein [Raineya sp.]MDW8295895.1 hypothetical protein [Raineya sp.]